MQINIFITKHSYSSFIQCISESADACPNIRSGRKLLQTNKKVKSLSGENRKEATGPMVDNSKGVVNITF